MRRPPTRISAVLARSSWCLHKGRPRSVDTAEVRSRTVDDALARVVVKDAEAARQGRADNTAPLNSTVPRAAGRDHGWPSTCQASSLLSSHSYGNGLWRPVDHSSSAPLHRKTPASTCTSRSSLGNPCLATLLEYPARQAGRLAEQVVTALKLRGPERGSGASL